MNNTQILSPKVSVIMNCLNNEKYLKEAIDSVYSQTFKDWEIILWDDASTDKSADIARSYDNKLRYFKSDKTFPLGRVRNLALEKALGKYVAFLDCDDIWLPRKLERQVSLLDENPNIGMVYCDTVVFMGKKDLYSLYKKDKPLRGRVFGELLVNYTLPILTVVIRKEALLGLCQWYDDTLTMGEDMDLFLRIAHNWDIDYVDEPLAKYRMHGESESYKKTYLIAEEEEIILQKIMALYPEVNSKYSNEIKVLREKIDCHKALGKWCNGDKKNARHHIRPYIFRRKNCLIIYLMTIFPYSIFRRINNLYYRLKHGV